MDDFGAKYDDYYKLQQYLMAVSLGKLVAQSVKCSPQAGLCVRKKGPNSEFKTKGLQVIPFSKELIILTMHLWMRSCQMG